MFEFPQVAPHAGAWIETSRWRKMRQSISSHPTRVRGLKPGEDEDYVEDDYVAPHAGAWIETGNHVAIVEEGRRTPRGCVD